MKALSFYRKDQRKGTALKHLLAWALCVCMLFGTVFFPAFAGVSETVEYSTSAQPGNPGHSFRDQTKQADFAALLSSPHFSQETVVDGVRFVFLGAENAIDPQIGIYVEWHLNNDFEYYANRALGITPGDGRTIVYHNIFSLTGPEAAGEIYLRMEQLGFLYWASQYPGATLSVHALAYQPGASSDTERAVVLDSFFGQDQIEFGFTRMGDYDVAAVLSLPQNKPAEEPKTETAPAVETTPEPEDSVEILLEDNAEAEDQPESEPAVEETLAEEPAAEEPVVEEPVVEEPVTEEPAAQEDISTETAPDPESNLEPVAEESIPVEAAPDAEPATTIPDETQIIADEAESGVSEEETRITDENGGSESVQVDAEEYTEEETAETTEVADSTESGSVTETASQEAEPQNTEENSPENTDGNQEEPAAPVETVEPAEVQQDPEPAENVPNTNEIAVEEKPKEEKPEEVVEYDNTPVEEYPEETGAKEHAESAPVEESFEEEKQAEAASVPAETQDKTEELIPETYGSIEIVKQPENATGKEGDTIRFAVEASGSNLSYQWQRSSDGAEWADIRNDSSAFDGALTPELFFKATSGTISRQYRCVISNAEEAITTRPVTVVAGEAVPTVPEPAPDQPVKEETPAAAKTENEKSQPKETEFPQASPAAAGEFAIVKQPENVIGKEGDMIRFAVEASGNNLSYQWQRTSNGEEWVDIRNESSAFNGALSPVLSFKATSGTISRQYRCVISSGDHSLTTRTAAVVAEAEMPAITEELEPAGEKQDEPEALAPNEAESTNAESEDVISGEDPGNEPTSAENEEGTSEEKEANEPETEKPEADNTAAEEPEKPEAEDAENTETENLQEPETESSQTDEPEETDPKAADEDGAKSEEEQQEEETQPVIGEEEQPDGKDEAAENADEGAEPTGLSADRKVDFVIEWDDEYPTIGSTAHFQAILNGYENLNYTLQWQYSQDEENWFDLEGADGMRMDQEITMDNYKYFWRVAVNVMSVRDE